MKHLYSTSWKSLNKRHVWTKKFFASRRVRTFNFCAQTHADTRRRRRTHTDERRHMQNFLAAFFVQSVTYMFRPWASLPANTCLMLVAFQDPEIQLALDWCFWNPVHKLKALRTSVSLGNLAWFLNVLLRVLAVRWSLLACIWPKVNTFGTRSMFPKPRPQTKSTQN